MATPQDEVRPCMEISDTQLKLDQVQAAMKVMMERARSISDTPVCLAIVDAAGNLEAFAKMDNARLFTRRHAVPLAWEERMSSIDRSVSENGDPMITYEQGGVVIIKDGAILGGIGVGGLRGHNADEDLGKLGLEAMNL